MEDDLLFSLALRLDGVSINVSSRNCWCTLELLSIPVIRERAPCHTTKYRTCTRQLAMVTGYIGFRWRLILPLRDAKSSASCQRRCVVCAHIEGNNGRSICADGIPQHSKGVCVDWVPSMHNANITVIWSRTVHNWTIWEYLSFLCSATVCSKPAGPSRPTLQYARATLVPFPVQGCERTGSV